MFIISFSDKVSSSQKERRKERRKETRKGGGGRKAAERTGSERKGLAPCHSFDVLTLQRVELELKKMVVLPAKWCIARGEHNMSLGFIMFIF